MVVVLLALSAQLQRFLQSYKDESQVATQAAAATAGGASQRKEFVGDFQVYYTASVIVRRFPDRRLYYPQPGGQILMDNVPANTEWGEAARFAGFNSTMPFNYPPFAALLLHPLSLFKWPAALLVWRVMLASLVLLAVYLSVSLTGPENFWLKFGFAALGAISFFPLSETFAEGQIDPFILLSWVAGVYFFQRGRTFWSALLFALGTVIKVSPAIVVVLLLIRRRWTWLISYAAALAALIGVSIWRLGWSNHILFLKEVLPKLGCGMPLLGNRSLAGLIYDIYLRGVPLEMGPTVPAWLCTVVKLVGLIVLAATGYLLWRHNKSKMVPTEEFMAFALLSLLISPVSWRHHYLLALLPLIYMWGRDIKDRWALVVLAVATLSIGSVLPDYVIASVRNPAIDLVLVSITPLSTLALLWVICRGQWEADTAA